MNEIQFRARSWLNWLAIQAAIVRINWRRWPTSWLVDLLATATATVLLIPAWAIYRLVTLAGRIP